MPELAAIFRKKSTLTSYLADKGAIEKVAVATAINCEFSYLEKTRIDAHTIFHKAKDLIGKKIAIVDDRCNWWNYFSPADALRSQGATEVHAMFPGLFTGGAIARLVRYVDGVHATSSRQNP
ncbi:MAG: hypothetical protein CM15mP8_2830 [Methanobacteriota archaeon]|nr:MAG: hypothetical protein CM15mP8_2830 [Euryarchaeota archaeon]